MRNIADTDDATRRVYCRQGNAPGLRRFSLRHAAECEYVIASVCRSWNPAWINIEDKESRMDHQSKREAAAELEVEITEPTTLEFQSAVAPHPNTEVSERLSFALDGKPVQALEIS